MNPLLTLFLGAAVEALGWTLVHFVWQGILVAASLALILLLLRSRSANARYLAACTALLVMVALPPITYLKVQKSTQPTQSEQAIQPNQQRVETSPTWISPPPVRYTNHPISTERELYLPLPAVVMEEPASEPVALPPWREQIGNSSRIWLPWVVYGWLTGVLLLSFRLLGSWILMQRLKRRSVKPAHEACLHMLDTLKRRLALSHTVWLLESTMAKVPTMIGWLRPVILLPASALTGLEPKQLEAILAHELAHIRRHDYLVNLIQTTVETLLFYHPVVWWVSHRIRIERENCCDDVAVGLCDNKVSYVRALATLERLRSTPPRLAVASGGGTLLGRIRRIVEVPFPNPNRSSGWLAGAFGIVTLSALALAVQVTGFATDANKAEQELENSAVEEKYRGRTIQQWIESLGSEWYPARRNAEEALVEIGEPAVPALIELVEDNSKLSWKVFQIFGKMGPQAREALPVLIEIAQEKGRAGRERTQAVRAMGSLGAKALPILKSLAEDAGQSDKIREEAVGALAGQEKPGLDLLKAYASSEDAVLKQAAIKAIIQRNDRLGIEPKKVAYARLIEEDPFHPDTPGRLGTVKGRVNGGSLHPLTQEVKRIYRERLKKDPDPEVAWLLANIIQDQLHWTALYWAAPANSGTSPQCREDPEESFHTLAEVLEVGFQSSDTGSALWKNLGVALASLRLLQGDLSRMNDVLEQLYGETIPLEKRPWLPAPPPDWGAGLVERWGIANESMRSGNSSLVVTVEKHGKGVSGVQVLIKKNPPYQNVFYSGWPADRLAACPLFRPDKFWGYQAQDRLMTRYGVTDENGQVRFDRLPDLTTTLEELEEPTRSPAEKREALWNSIPFKIDVVVPTANFPERGNRWELWMEVEPGKFERAARYGPDVVPQHSLLPVVRLEKGKTVHYPKLVVRPTLELGTEDWAKVSNREDFQLHWQQLSSPGKVEYELAMALSAPGDFRSIRDSELQPIIRSERITREDNRWNVGEHGVGNLRIIPGSIYTFQVTARDASGNELARSTMKRVWVPWAHRETDQPYTGNSLKRVSPIKASTWYDHTLKRKVEAFLKNYPDAFECDYVRVGQAWIDWHQGKTNEARAQLSQLIQELPRGNVARATAAWLVEQIDARKEPPKRLEFVADEKDSTDETTSGAAQSPIKGTTTPETTTIKAQDLSLAGTVRDKFGQPIADVKVTNWHPLGSNPQRTYTDSNGKFYFEKHRGMAVMAGKEGFAPTLYEVPEQQYVAEYSNKRPMSMEMILEEGGEVEGTVLDEETGQPIRGAQVWIDRWGEGPRHGHRYRIWISRPTTTDERGRFRFSRLPTGSMQVRAATEGFSKIRSEDFELAEGDKKRIDLRLSRKSEEEIKQETEFAGRDRSLSGTVTDASGAPVGGVHISNFFPHGSSSQTTSTDAQGAFHFERERGYVIIAKKGGYAPTFYECRDEYYQRYRPPGEEPYRVLIQLARGGTVEGRILSVYDDTPVPSARVWLERWGKDEAVGCNRYIIWKSEPVEADALGRFHIPHAPDGQLRLHAKGDKFAENHSEEFTIADGGRNEIILRLFRGTELTLHTFDQQTQRPIAGANVQPFGVGKVESDEQGRCVFPNVRPGHFTLLCRAEGYREFRDEIQVEQEEGAKEIRILLLPKPALESTETTWEEAPGLEWGQLEPGSEWPPASFDTRGEASGAETFLDRIDFGGSVEVEGIWGKNLPYRYDRYGRTTLELDASYPKDSARMGVVIQSRRYWEP